MVQRARAALDVRLAPTHARSRRDDSAHVQISAAAAAMSAAQDTPDDITPRDVAAAQRAWTQGAAEHDDPTIHTLPFGSAHNSLPPGHPDRESLVAPQPSGDPVVSMRLQLRQLRGFWGRHGARLSRLWAALDATSKENVLQECVIGMPRWRGDINATGRGQSEGICHVAPELNARDLALPPDDGRSLPALVAACVAEPLDVLLRGDGAFFTHKAAAAGLRSARPGRRAVVLLPDRLGEVVEVKKPPFPPSRNPALRQMFERGAMVEEWVWQSICDRRSFMLSTCTAVADEFRQEILGRVGFGLSRASMACSACGRSHLKDAPAKAVQMCAGCGVTAYCCKACQKAHWKAHKTACRRAGGGAKRGAAGGADGAAGDGADCAGVAAAAEAVAGLTVSGASGSEG